jgi:GNAT superfamily N-acetyltransferase
MMGVAEDELFYAERDTDLLLALRAQVWGGQHPHTDARFFSWLLAKNPPGEPAGIMVRHRGRAVGFAGLCGKRQYAAGREVTLAHGLDYMIEPGLADVLAGKVALRVPQRWHLLAQALGFTSSVVFPNRNSMRMLTSRRIGMVPVYQPDLLVRPLATARFAQGTGSVPSRALAALTCLASVASWLGTSAYGRPKGEAVPVERFDDGFDELWLAARDGLGISTIRDAAYLQWRFKEHPIYSYWTVGWRQGNTWLGYAACVERRLFGVDTLLVVDVLTPQWDSVGSALIDAAVDEARRRGLGMVVTLALRGAPLYDTFKSRGFIHVPSRLDPKRFTATERIYDDSVRGDFAALPRQFTWSDMDVV